MMKQKTFILTVFIGILFIQTVSGQELLKTSYYKGEFVTVCQKEVHTSGEYTSVAITRMIEESHTNPQNLFSWAFKGLGLQGQNNDEMVVVLKSSTFDKKNSIIHGFVDVEVPYVKTFNNVKIDALVKNELLPNGCVNGIADVLHSGFLLKKAKGTVTYIPLKNGNQLMKTETHIRFGWFLDLFISQKRYKSIVEWRVEKFTNNLQKEAEKKSFTAEK